eukprot:10967980-Alexandrium_andersonii.AAC.1
MRTAGAPALPQRRAPAPARPPHDLLSGHRGRLRERAPRHHSSPVPTKASGGLVVPPRRRQEPFCSSAPQTG